MNWKEKYMMVIGRRISADSRIPHWIVDPLSESRIQYATIRKSLDIRIGYQILGSLLFQLIIAVQRFFIICLMISDSDIRYPISDQTV